jgi:hypothetical protein
MIRISINWDFVSPTLGSVSGIVDLDYVPDINTWIRLTSFRVSAKPGSIGYKALDDKGIPTVYLDAVKFQLDAIVRAYKQGVTMDKNLYSWIIDEDIEESIKEIEKIPEIVESDDLRKTYDVCYVKKAGDVCP